MTAILLHKLKDGYHVVADGRTLAGDELISDSSIKVFRTTRNTAIYGICGSLSDYVTIKNIVNKHALDPIALRDHFNKPEVLFHLDCFGVLLVNSRQQIIEIDKRNAGHQRIGDEAIPTKECPVRVLVHNDEDLPLCVGSGSTYVLTLLRASRRIRTSNDLYRVFFNAYKSNVSIGGRIREEVLEVDGAEG